MADEKVTAEDRFRRAVADFYRAGQRVSDLWYDEDEDFNADVRFPPGVHLLPMSFDEWIVEFAEQYGALPLPQN